MNILAVLSAVDAATHHHKMQFLVGGTHTLPFLYSQRNREHSLATTVSEFDGNRKLGEVDLSTLYRFEFLCRSALVSLEKPFNESNVMLLSGAIAGICSRTVTAPLDRIKVALQAGLINTPQQQRVSFSVWEVSRMVYQDGGWKSFFRGNGANVVKVAPETATRFLVYEKAMKRICSDPSKATTKDRVIAGSTAGFISQSLIYPLEIAKTRLSLSQPGEYSGIICCLRKVATNEGVMSLYRGLLPSLLGIIPYAGVDLAVFNTLKQNYISSHDGRAPPVTMVLGFGALSSSCGQAISYPLQLVRTKLQAQGMSGRPIVYQGAMDCFFKVIRADGILGLYRGILPNFAKTVPSISVSYAVYETIKSKLA